MQNYPPASQNVFLNPIIHAISSKGALENGLGRIQKLTQFNISKVHVLYLVPSIVKKITMQSFCFLVLLDRYQVHCEDLKVDKVICDICEEAGA